MSYELLSEVEVACRRERSGSVSLGGYSVETLPEITAQVTTVLETLCLPWTLWRGRLYQFWQFP